MLFSISEVLMAGTAYSQSLRLDVTNDRLVSVFHEIEQQTSLQFTWPEEIESIDGISINSREEGLDLVLAKLAKKAPVSFKQVNNMIAVSKASAPRTMPVSRATGTIKGRIVDFQSLETLPGANVMLVGTQHGTSSDADGYYQLDGVPEGEYQLKVTFIGYEPYTEQIEIKEGWELTRDVKLRADVSSMDELVVEGKRSAISYSSEVQMVETVKEARSVVSGISNEQIAKSADRNAAQAVKRISGVSVADDKFVVVRGMNPRYNLTYLNDNLAPSTELYSQAFAYDMLPTSIIDRIEVYKSPTAELLGSYGGGAVKIFTKNAVPVQQLNIGFRTSYLQGTTFEDMNGYNGGQLDWLGFDDGTRELPHIPSYRETGGRQTMSQQQMVSSFTDTWQYGHQQTLPDMKLFANYFDNWKVFGSADLHSMTSLTYTRSARHFVQDRTVGGGFVSSDEDREEWGKAIGTFTLNDESSQTVKLNLLQNFTLQLNEHNRLKLNNFLLNNAQDNTTITTSHPNQFLRGPDMPEINSFASKTNTFNYQRRFLYNGNLGGNHEFGLSVPQTLSWNAGYSYSLQDVPDQRVVSFGGNNSGYVNDAYRWTAFRGSSQNIFYGLMSRLFINSTENVYNASADYSLKPLPNIEFKAGTYHLYRTREMDRRFFKVLPGNFTGTETDANLQFGSVDLFQNYPALIRFREQDLSWIWDPRNFPDDGTGLKLFDVSSPIDHYVASEQNNSGYLQGEWAPMGEKIVINAGLRLEYNQQKVAGAGALNVRDEDGEPAGEIFFPVPVSLENTDWLPSVHINYRPNPAWVLRASYGRTVNRPGFREIAPFNDVDFIAREEIEGNPGLQSSSIDNYDLRVEFYPEQHQNEAIRIGAFYKQINQPIERLRFESSSDYITRISFLNTDMAKVYGLELEVRKSLNFLLGNLFRNLSFVLNGTLIESEVSRDDSDVEYNNTSSLGYRLGSFSGRPLQGQAPYVLNSGLFYENPGWGTKLGLVYNVTGPSIYAIAAGGNGIRDILQKLKDGEGGLTQNEWVRLQTHPSLIEAPRHLLDLSFSQRLYKGLSLRANVQNLLDQPNRLAEDNNWNYKWDKPSYSTQTSAGSELLVADGDNDLNRYHPGRYYSLTLTYSF